MISPTPDLVQRSEQHMPSDLNEARAANRDSPGLILNVPFEGLRPSQQNGLSVRTPPIPTNTVSP